MPTSIRVSHRTAGEEAVLKALRDGEIKDYFDHGLAAHAKDIIRLVADGLVRRTNDKFGLELTNDGKHLAAHL